MTTFLDQAQIVDKKVDDFVMNLLQAVSIVGIVMLLSLGLRTGIIVASLMVYDLRGRRVRQLVRDGSSSLQEAVWDLRDDSGRRVGAGTYLLRLESKGGVATEKTIVLGNKR